MVGKAEGWGRLNSLFEGIELANCFVIQFFSELKYNEKMCISAGIIGAVVYLA